MPEPPQVRSSGPNDLRDNRVLQLHFGRFLNPREHNPPYSLSNVPKTYEAPIRIKINVRASQASQPMRQSSAATIKVLKCHDKLYYHIQPDQPIQVAVDAAFSKHSVELKLTIQIDRTLDKQLDHNLPLVSCDPFRQIGLNERAYRILLRGRLPPIREAPFRLELARTVGSLGQNNPKIVRYDPDITLEVCHHWTNSDSVVDHCSRLLIQPPRVQFEVHEQNVKPSNPSVTLVKAMGSGQSHDGSRGTITPDKARPFDRFGGKDNAPKDKPQHRDSILHWRPNDIPAPDSPHNDHAGSSMSVMEAKQGSSIGHLSGTESRSHEMRTRYREGISHLVTPHMSFSPSPEPTIETEDMPNSIDSSRLRKRRKRNPNDIAVDEAEKDERSGEFETLLHNKSKPQDLRRSVAASRLSPSAALQRRQIARPREDSTSTSATDRGTRSTSEAVSSVTSYEEILSDARKPLLEPRRGSSSAIRSLRQPTPRSATAATTTDTKSVLPIYDQAMPFRNTLPTRTKGRFRVPKAPDKASLYKSVSKTRLREGEVVSESDDDNGRSHVWQTLKDDNELNLLRDPNEHQKRFLKLWNRHSRHEDLHADRYMAASWLRFTRAYAEELNQPAMLKEFCVRAGLEKMDGRLTNEDVSESIRIVTTTRTQDDIDPATTSQKAWSVACICGEVPTDIMNMVVCSNEVCTNPEFHLVCAGLVKRPKQWLCPSCQTVG